MGSRVANGRRIVGAERGWGGCRSGGGRLHPLDRPLPPPMQCFSFNGHDKAEIMKWPEAKQACERQGAVLATIASPLEQGRSPPPPPAPLAWDLLGVVLSASPIACSFHHIHAAQHLLRPLDWPPRHPEGVPVGGGRAAAARELGAWRALGLQRLQPPRQAGERDRSVASPIPWEGLSLVSHHEDGRF